MGNLEVAAEAQGRQVFGVESRGGQMAWAVARCLNSVPLPRKVTGGLKYKGGTIPSMLLKDPASRCVPPASSLRNLRSLTLL